MDFETARQTAHQRMREIGKAREEYHVEAVAIAGNTKDREFKKITLKAYNDYYYLVDYETYYGLEIISDTGYFNADNPSNNTIQEFNGVIEIREIFGKSWSIDDPKARVPKIMPVNFIKVTVY